MELSYLKGHRMSRYDFLFAIIVEGSTCGEIRAGAYVLRGSFKD